MYELYEVKKSTYKKNETKCEYKNIEVVDFSSELFGSSRKGVLIAFVWKVITIKKPKAYIIRDAQGAIIHSTCVIPKCFKFPFMGKDDIHIGPCVTVKEYRGLGLFPYVVSSVIENELNDENSAYSMINTKNISSIEGFKKVGFLPIALMRKDKARRHVIVKRYESLEESQNELFK